MLGAGSYWNALKSPSESPRSQARGGNCCCALSCWSILCCERSPAACWREPPEGRRQARAEEREALVRQEQGTAKASTQ